MLDFVTHFRYTVRILQSLKGITMQRPQLSKLATKIFWGIVVVTLLFVVGSLAVDMFNSKSSSIFTVTLKDSEIVDVVVITSTPYTQDEWNIIKSIVASVASKYDDIGIINPAVNTALHDYSILAATTSRQKQILELRNY